MCCWTQSWEVPQPSPLLPTLPFPLPLPLSLPLFAIVILEILCNMWYEKMTVITLVFQNFCCSFTFFLLAKFENYFVKTPPIDFNWNEIKCLA